MKRIILLSTLASALALTGWAKCNCNCSRMGGETVAGEAAEKAKDPVCGMDVDTAKAEKSTHNGKTYYFCSKSCKEKFDKNPSQYADKK